MASSPAIRAVRKLPFGTLRVSCCLQSQIRFSVWDQEVLKSTPLNIHAANDDIVQAGLAYSQRDLFPPYQSERGAGTTTRVRGEDDAISGADPGCDDRVTDLIKSRDRT